MEKNVENDDEQYCDHEDDADDDDDEDADDEDNSILLEFELPTFCKLNRFFLLLHGK